MKILAGFLYLNLIIGPLLLTYSVSAEQGEVEVYAPFFIENRYQGDTAVYFAASEDIFSGSQIMPLVDASYTVKSGDSLVAISRSIFGTSSHWLKIYNMNSDRISDPNIIEPGMILKVKTKANIGSGARFTFIKNGAMAASTVMPYFDKWVHKGILSEIQTLVRADNQGKRLISFEDLGLAGLTVEFRKENLELHIFVPPKNRKTVIHHFGVKEPEITGRKLFVPNQVSGFLNVYGTQGLEINQNDKDFATPPAYLSADTTFNVNGYVFEGQASYNDSDSPNFQRQDLRIVKDYPENMLRASIGDLVYPVTQYQSYKAIGGLSVTRNFDLKPYKIVVPSSHRDFFLKSPAVVTVIQNGVRLESIELSSGYHRLQNLPISPGINLIVLEIRDQAGRIEYINMPISTNGELLKAGLHQFTYNVGYPSTPKNGDRNYDGTNPVFSGFHRYGLTNGLTFGSSVQRKEDQTIGALELLSSVGVGSVGAEVAVSRTANFPTDVAQRITYTYDDYRKENETFRIGFLSLEHRGESFTQLDNLPPDRRLEYQILASYGQSIYWGLNASLSFSYEFNRKITTDITDANQSIFSLSKSWRNGFSFSVNAIHGVSNVGQTDNEIIVLLTWNLPDGKQSIDLLADSVSETTRMDWRYTESGQVNRWQARAGAGQAADDAIADFDINYIGNRGNIGLSHSAIAPPAGTTTQESQLRVSTGIAMTGGQLAMGPPIADSFVIVTKPDHWLDQAFEVNPTISRTYDTQVNSFGPGVIANIPSYQYYPLYLDNTQVAEGYFFDPTSYTVLPSYKSGFLVEPGTDASVVVRGQILDSKGLPIPLMAGTIVDNVTGKEVDFFTNRTGFFIAEGLKEGQFEIISNLGRYEQLTITIPAEYRGSFSLGTIVLFDIE